MIQAVLTMTSALSNNMEGSLGGGDEFALLEVLFSNNMDGSLIANGVLGIKERRIVPCRIQYKVKTVVIPHRNV